MRAFLTYFNVAIRHATNVMATHSLRVISVWSIYVTYVVIASPHIACGTTIVAMVDSEEHKIVLGADSRIITLEQQRGRTVGHYSGCKIVVMPDCVVATAGVTVSHAFAFDVHQLARQACGVPGNLSDKADTFADQALQAVRTLSEQVVKLSPAVYKKTFIPGEEIVQALFAGVQNSRLSLLGRVIFAGGEGIIDSKKIDAMMNGPTPYVLLGQDQAIIDYMNANPDWNQDDSANIVRQFLDMEVQARPDLVSPPISILEIVQNVMSPEQATDKWLSEGACKDAGE
jgi:hypothetical protein